MLYLDTNNRDDLKFAQAAGWFSREITDDDAATAHAVSLQQISEAIRRVRYLIQDAPVNYVNGATMVNELWEEIVSIVRQQDGASAAEQPSLPVIEAATNSPSPKPSKRKA